MNWDQIAGSWKEMRGSARAKWREITEDEWHQIAGRRDEMIGTPQRRYGVAKQKDARKVDEWTQGL